MFKDSIPVDAIHRVLVIKLRHHGDVLLSSPVFSVLKAHAPQAEIDALVYGDLAGDGPASRPGAHAGFGTG